MAAKTAHSPHAEILRQRVLTVLGRLSASSIAQALQAPNELEMLSIIGAAASGKRPANVDAMVAERLAAARFKERIATEAGGLLDARQVLRISKLTTTQAVYKAAGERRLLAVETDDGLRYPAFQFMGNLPKALPRILKAAPNTGGWAMMQFLFGRHEGLTSNRPLDLLNRDEHEIERAVCFARALED